MSRLIHLLPEHLINQVKAGEVIERPALLLKEILENSLDANATSIEISISNNGLDRIEIKDNGCGISFDDLPFAFARHATSKLNKFEDLSTLSSFGFRGEALASIAAISKLTCHSKRLNEDSCEIMILGGMVQNHIKREHFPFESGTHLIIQDLFFNTPARLKFIQSESTEKNHIKKILYGYVLSNPEVHFKIKFDQQDFDEFLPKARLIERLEDFKNKNEKNFTPVTISKSYEEMELNIIWVPEHIKIKHRLDYLFVNKRLVYDKSLLRIASQSFERLEQKGQFIINLSLPTEHLDINVHPNKTILKYFEPGKVIQLIHSSIQSMFQIPSNQNNQKSNSSEMIFDSQIENKSPITYEQFQASSVKSEFELVHRFEENHLAIIKKEQKIYLLDTLKFLTAYISKHLFENCDSIPLLVSEKILGLKFSKLELVTLNELGFEIDEMSVDFFLLRSYPLWMDSFYSSELAQCLVRNINTVSKNINISSLTKQLKSNSHFKIDTYLNFVLSSEIANSEYFKEIQPENLAKMIYE
jgi:DNA mismatch repair protein MutL